MTEQIYYSELLPGQVADFRIDMQVPKEFDDDNDWVSVLRFAYENLKGPFSFHTPSTAHYYFHIKVSHDEDVELLESLGNTRYTHSTTWGKPTHELTHKSADVVNRTHQLLQSMCESNIYETPGSVLLRLKKKTDVGGYHGSSMTMEGLLAPKNFSKEDTMLYKLKWGVRPLTVTPDELNDYVIERDALIKAAWLAKKGGS